MSSEAGFSVTARDARGTLHTLRGDTYAEFTANLDQALGAEGAGLFLSDYRQAFGVTDGGVGAAVHTVQQQIGVVAPATPAAIGGFTPPGQAAAPVAPAGAPVTANYPGDCPHGQRQYKDSIARGASWKRWECAIPWSKDVQGRCKPVNV